MCKWVLGCLQLSFFSPPSPALSTYFHKIFIHYFVMLRHQFMTKSFLFLSFFFCLFVCSFFGFDFGCFVFFLYLLLYNFSNFCDAIHYILQFSDPYFKYVHMCRCFLSWCVCVCVCFIRFFFLFASQFGETVIFGNRRNRYHCEICVAHNMIINEDENKRDFWFYWPTKLWKLVRLP